MKQFTEDELKALLVGAYEQGFEDCEYGVHNAAHVESLNPQDRDEYVTGVIESL
jgi:hypothetical protein